MAKQKLNRRIILIFIVTLLGLTVIYILFTGIFDNRKEIVISSNLQFYSFDSSTILKSIAQGKTNVFTLLEKTPDASSSSPTVSVSWSQDDFFLVAQTLHRQIMAETLGAQNLTNLFFNLDCSSIEKGAFKEADFTSKQLIRNGEGETRIEIEMHISPSYNEVMTLKKEISPNLIIQYPLDLTSFRITAEMALQIAEKNGGSEERLRANNACQIDVGAPTTDNKGWYVMYLNSHNINESLFEIDIDSTTGEYTILYPKPK